MMSSDDNKLRQTLTEGGHVEDRTQPSLPVVHRRFANPSPLGLLSFATGIFLISSFGVHARGIQTPNVMISVLIFFGGICQYLVGIVIYTVAAIRSSWALFLNLVALDVYLILLATGNMVQSTAVLNAGYAFGYFVAIFQL
ncbi:hypothetical protein CEP52_003764 [Fusarium oligoseptatum]|uniref:Uncharacterized protein n=1 Tax=Fusarium oligoseptatum TaxID=2604345 RepID=A0A428U709_9HYPO|nr:hypothetical protein CEP52_003764 [Fusarium oligoseptatum]